MFHDRTKHIEVDCYFIREVVMKGDMCIPYVKSDEQLDIDYVSSFQFNKVILF